MLYFLFAMQLACTANMYYVAYINPIEMEWLLMYVSHLQTLLHSSFFSSPPLALPYISDRKLLEEKLSLDSIVQETDFSRSMILRGVSPHLQCSGCHKLIQDPRVLACSHTYCRTCLDNISRKIISFSKFQNYSNPVYKPSKNSISTGDEMEENETDFSLDYTLRTFLGTSLNEELKTSLGQILNPDFSGIDKIPDKVELNKKKVPNNSKHAGAAESSSGKSKKAKKQQDRTPTGKVNSSGSNCSSSSSASSVNSASTKLSVAAASGVMTGSKSQSKKQSVQDSERTVDVLICPKCGMHTEIPDGNLSLVPYNFFVQHIMDLMSYYSSAEPVPLVHCSACRKDGVVDLPPAVVRCSTCASFLCKQCFELHSIDDFTKLHSTLTITERGESSMFSCLTPGDSNARTCKAHNWKPFAYYCITCSRGICETCSKGSHRAHLFSKPEDLRSDFVTYIRDLMSRTSQLRRRTEGAVRTTQELMSGIQLLAATQIEEVLRTQDVLASALDTRLSVMMQEVDKLSGGMTEAMVKGSGKK